MLNQDIDLIFNPNNSQRYNQISNHVDFAWSYTHTTTDTSTAAVDVLPTPTGFAVLANFLPDYSTYSQPYIVFLTDSGTLQGLLPLGRNDKTLLAFKMQLNPTDSSLVVAANEYTTSGKVIPTLYTINKTGTTYKSFSYTADDHCEIHSLAQDPTGNWWLAGESYSSGDTLATVIKTNYAYTKRATYTYSYTTGYGSFNDIIAHSEGLLATGIVESTGTFGEGYRDVLLQHLAFSGDSTLAETLGGSAHDEGHGLVLLPDQPIAFGVGYDNSYGVEESGNAYVFGVKVGELQASSECVVPRILQADAFATRDNNTGLIVPKILNSASQTEANNLIQFALDNNFQYIALFKLGFIFDSLGVTADKSTYKNVLINFITSCTQNGLLVGYIADQTVYALNSVAYYNIDKFNTNSPAKLNFVKLEHEYWNAFNDPDLNSNIAQTIAEPNPIQTTAFIAIDLFYEALHADHLWLLDTLNEYKWDNANMWQVYDYIGALYNNIDVSQLSNPLSVFTSYHDNNYVLQQNIANDLKNKSDAIFLPYYQHYLVFNGQDFLRPSSTASNVIIWRNRLDFFGDSISPTVIIPLFSAEDVNYCGGSPFLGHVLEDLPYNGSESLFSIESTYNVQHDSIYHSTTYNEAQFTKLGAYAWFKYDCIKNKTFTTVDNISCHSIDFGFEPLMINESDFTEIDLFPNPASNKIYVNSRVKLNRYSIYNSFGQCVLTAKTIQNQQIEIDVSNLPCGFYFVQGHLNGQIANTTKFIKL